MTKLLLMQTIVTSAALVSLLLGSSAGCESSRGPEGGAVAGAQPNLTHGAVQLKLRKGVTTQTDVIEAFGAPNIATRDGDGREVWTYRRHATVTSFAGSDAYFNILVFGASGRSGSESTTSQSMTLIVKFDESQRVSDFRSLASSF